MNLKHASFEINGLSTCTLYRSILVRYQLDAILIRTLQTAVSI